MDKDVIMFAMEEAALQNKRTMSYLEGILKNKEKDGFSPSFWEFLLDNHA